MKITNYQDLVYFIGTKLMDRINEIDHVIINDSTRSSNTVIKPIDSENLIQQIIDELANTKALVVGKHTTINSDVIDFKAWFKKDSKKYLEIIVTRRSRKEKRFIGYKITKGTFGELPKPKS